MTKIIAHRGYSEKLIDNSKEAFQEAINQKFTMIELDIQLSKDNFIFIFHDTFIGDYRLEDLNLKEIIKLNSTIFTLEEFLKLFYQNSIEIYLDIKGVSLSICEKLHEHLRTLHDLQKIYIASYNFAILEKLHILSLDANISYQLGLITENIFSFDFFKTIIKRIDMKFISFYWEILDKAVIDFLHKQGLVVFTYTCKNSQIYYFMERFPVDGIVSNIVISEKMKKSKKKKIK